MTPPKFLAGRDVYLGVVWYYFGNHNKHDTMNSEQLQSPRERNAQTFHLGVEGTLQKSAAGLEHRPVGLHPPRPAHGAVQVLRGAAKQSCTCGSCDWTRQQMYEHACLFRSGKLMYANMYAMRTSTCTPLLRTEVSPAFFEDDGRGARTCWAQQTLNSFKTTRAFTLSRSRNIAARQKRYATAVWKCSPHDFATPVLAVSYVTVQT